MNIDEIDVEIEKLHGKKIELASRINIVHDADKKDEMRLEIERLQKQIDVLERFRKKA